MFEEEEVNFDIMKTMTDQELKDIGVNTFGKRWNILKAVRNLI